MASAKQAEFIKTMVDNLQNAPYLNTAADSSKKRWMEDVMRLPSYDDDDNAIRRTLDEVTSEYNQRCDAIKNANFDAMSATDASKLIDALKSKFVPTV